MIFEEMRAQLRAVHESALTTMDDLLARMRELGKQTPSFVSDGAIARGEAMRAQSVADFESAMAKIDALEQRIHAIEAAAAAKGRPS